MPRTQEVPQTTQMVKNNILEIHQDGETDTPQNNQQGYIDEERVVPRHHQRIAQISGQRGESRIAESGNGMKSGKGQLFLKVHPHRPVDVSPDSKHPYSFNHQRKGQNIDQGGEQGIQGIGTHHVAHHQLIVQRGITHEEHGKETRQCHHSQTAYLNQQNDYHKTGRSKSGRHIDRRQPRDAHRTGGYEQRVDPRYAVHRAARQHQQPRAYHYDYQETGSQDKRRVRTPPQQPYQPVGKAEKGKHQQQDKMIGLAMQKFPELQDGALLLRTMENDRNKGQIEQNGQYPGELTERAPGILVFQQNAQSDICQENNPHPMVQALELMRLGL